ncbi:hypothetical protein IVB18_27295 [Bradyrhizobium sp. 186]|uniref:hypothetical protein n=1 Tax=Bradyrhizobium sp. 186 TaxID=2782654 RepID=UPI0020011DA9|nr:hypothetical protein [Bradyrhizobium sp. 186]UPK32020.1 hypothetical protein IVB18_27295 [Bradyrhizobium sp. 186]
MDWQKLGFTLTPTGMHPFGTSNRLAVSDVDATRRALSANGVDFQISGPVLLVPPAASHGLALEFVEQETI